MEKKEITAIKNLFCLPLGSFPRGGVDSSLNVRLTSKPNSLVLTSKSNSAFSISKIGDLYTVKAEINGEVKEAQTSDFVEAVKLLITPILEEEIESKCQSLD